MLGEHLIGLRSNADAGAAGDVVEDHGNVHPVRHIAEVLNQPFLGALVIIRRYHEDAVGAGVFSVLGVAESSLGVVAADAHDDLHAALVVIDGLADGLALLALGLGGGLAGGAADHDGGGAVLILEVDILFQPFKIHAFLGEGGDNGGAGAFENRCFNHNSLLMILLYLKFYDRQGLIMTLTVEIAGKVCYNTPVMHPVFTMEKVNFFEKIRLLF